MNNTGFIYLAYPIDQTTRPPAKLDAITRWLKAKGWGSYDPGMAFVIGNDQAPDRTVMAVNNMALGRSKGMVAFLPPGVPSIGVPIEIERASQNGLPVLILGGDTSWALAKYQALDHVRIAQPGQEIEGLLDWFIDAANRQDAGPRWQQLPVTSLREATPTEYSGQLPNRGYDGDAGFDLIVSQQTVIPMLGGEMVDVPCNLAVELPDWTWGLIVGRSSTLRTKRLQVHLGVIDSGYRGELFAAVSNLSTHEVVVQAGERLAQLIVMPNESRLFRPAMVAELTDSDRGVRGFGSTGR